MKKNFKKAKNLIAQARNFLLRIQRKDECVLFYWILCGWIGLNIGEYISANLSYKTNNPNSETYECVYKDFLVSDGEYNIVAETQGKIDSLTMVLDDISTINPFCAGFVKDLKETEQRIVIIPDTASLYFDDRTAAFYRNSDDNIYIRDSHLKGCKFMPRTFKERKELVKEAIQVSNAIFLNPKRMFTEKEYRDRCAIFYNFVLYDVLFHEGRHAQQDRNGLIQKCNEFYGNNLMDYVLSNGWIEADAETYSTLLINGGNYNYKKKMVFIKYFDCIMNCTCDEEGYPYNEQLDDSFFMEFLNISHLIMPKEIKDFKGTEIDTLRMMVFFDLFKNFKTPVSENNEVIYVENKSFPYDYNYKDLYWINYNPDNNRVPKSIEKYMTDGGFYKTDLMRFCNDSASVKDFFMTLLRRQRPDLFKNDQGR